MGKAILLMKISKQILKGRKPFLSTSVIWIHSLDENIQELSETDRIFGGGEDGQSKFCWGKWLKKLNKNDDNMILWKAM